MIKTWEFLIFICAVLIASSAFAGQFTTTTGQGYYTWNGQIISYYSFPYNYTFNLVNGVTATDTNGSNPSINQQASNAYMCSQSPTNPGC